MDIDVPNEEIEVTIRDAATNKRLSDAFVTGAVLRYHDAPADGLYQTPATAKGDTYLITDLAAGTPMRVCAQRAGYKQACNATVLIKKKGREVVVPDLQPANERAGHIDARGYRYLYWSNNNGVISETCQVQPDGTFHYEKDHREPEVAILVGTGPLEIGTVEAKGETLEIHVAKTTQQDVTVRFADESNRKNAIVAIWLRGVRIPHQALAAHQMQRRQPFLILKRAPVVIKELGGGPVAVAGGPDPEVLPPGTSNESPALFYSVKIQPPIGGVVTLP